LALHPLINCDYCPRLASRPRLGEPVPAIRWLVPSETSTREFFAIENLRKSVPAVRISTRHVASELTHLLRKGHNAFLGCMSAPAPKAYIAIKVYCHFNVPSFCPPVYSSLSSFCLRLSFEAVRFSSKISWRPSIVQSRSVQRCRLWQEADQLSELSIIEHNKLAGAARNAGL